MIWVAALALLALLPSPTGGSKRAGCVLACSRSRSKGCRRASTASGSPTSPTSISGCRSRGRVATERAVAWVAERRPDLVCITGDLVSHPRGVPLLVQLLGTLERPTVVLGNHDVAVTRDPFSRAAELDGLEGAAQLLAGRGDRRRAERATDPDRGRRCRELSARVCSTLGACRPRRRSPHPALPLPGYRPPPPCRSLPPRARGASPRGPDCPPLSGREGDTCASGSTVRRRGVSHRGRGDARLAGHRDNVRAVPILRTTGGDRARSPSCCPAPRTRIKPPGATIHLMEGHSLISADILASYAADAALEIEGVRGLVEGSRARGTRASRWRTTKVSSPSSFTSLSTGG